MDYDDGDACGDVDEWDDMEIKIASPECTTSTGVALSPGMKKKTMQAGGPTCCVNGVIQAACDQTVTERDAVLIDQAIEASVRVQNLVQDIEALRGGVGAVDPVAETSSDAQNAPNTAAGAAASAGGASDPLAQNLRRLAPLSGREGLGPLRFQPQFAFPGGGGGLNGGNLSLDQTGGSDTDSKGAAATQGAGTDPSGSGSGIYAGGGGRGKSAGEGDESKRGLILFGDASGRSGLGGSDGEFGNAGAPLPAVASEDPIDYFSRIDIGSSLFRQISRKLSEKEAGLTSP
jgi:hypothetical protein